MDWHLICCQAVHCIVFAPHRVFGVLEVFDVRAKVAVGATQFYQVPLLLRQPVAQAHLALM